MTDVDYVESGKWKQREKSSIAHLLPKGKPNVPMRSSAQGSLSDDRPSKYKNMDSAVYVAVLRHMLPHDVQDRLCEKPGVLCNAPASKK